MEVSLAELESMAIYDGLDSLVAGESCSPAIWIRFEAEVRSAHDAAAAGLRHYGGERCSELLRLLEVEEQTRCQAFQGVLMGEVHASVYQDAVRSILEKLLAKLETCSFDPQLYRGAAQVLSEYMSALNHHCDTIAVPSAEDCVNGLGAIAEAAGEYEEDILDTHSIASQDSLHSDSTLSSHHSQSHTSERGEHNGSASGFFAGAGSALLRSAGINGMAMPPVNDDLRRQRRRESNRTASSKYRSKKTATLSTLMADNAALRSQVAHLSSNAAILSAENKLLKQQVAFMQSILQGQPAEFPTPPGCGSIAAQHSGPPMPGPPMPGPPMPEPKQEVGSAEPSHDDSSQPYTHGVAPGQADASEQEQEQRDHSEPFSAQQGYGVNL